MGDDLLQALDAPEEGCAPPVDTKFEATFGYLAIAPWVSGGLIVTKSIAILLSWLEQKHSLIIMLVWVPLMSGPPWFSSGTSSNYCGWPFWPIPRAIPKILIPTVNSTQSGYQYVVLKVHGVLVLPILEWVLQRWLAGQTWSQPWRACSY